jgi:hypothetical protein
MKVMVVWILLVFHTPGDDRLPTAGIFTYASKADCEAEATAWKRHRCVKVEVPK